MKQPNALHFVKLNVFKVNNISTTYGTCHSTHVLCALRFSFIYDVICPTWCCTFYYLALYSRIDTLLQIHFLLKLKNSFLFSLHFNFNPYHSPPLHHVFFASFTHFSNGWVQPHLESASVSSATLHCVSGHDCSLCSTFLSAFTRTHDIN